MGRFIFALHALGAASFAAIAQANAGVISTRTQFDSSLNSSVTEYFDKENNFSITDLQNFCDAQTLVVGSRLDSTTILPVLSTDGVSVPAQGPGLVVPGVQFQAGPPNIPTDAFAPRLLWDGPQNCFAHPNSLRVQHSSILDIAFTVPTVAVGFDLPSYIQAPDYQDLLITDVISVFATNGTILRQATLQIPDAFSPIVFFGDIEPVNIGRIEIASFKSLFPGGDPVGTLKAPGFGPMINNLTFSDDVSRRHELPEPSAFSLLCAGLFAVACGSWISRRLRP